MHITTVGSSGSTKVAGQGISFCFLPQFQNLEINQTVSWPGLKPQWGNRGALLLLLGCTMLLPHVIPQITVTVPVSAH